MAKPTWTRRRAGKLRSAITQDELDKAKLEFFEAGGTIRHLPDAPSYQSSLVHVNMRNFIPPKSRDA